MKFFLVFLVGLTAGFCGVGTLATRRAALTPRETLHYVNVGVCKGHGAPADVAVFGCEDGYVGGINLAGDSNAR